jgi:hypothetical protein
MHRALLAGLIVFTAATSPAPAALMRVYAGPADDAARAAQTDIRLEHRVLAPRAPSTEPPRAAPAAPPAAVGLYRVTYRASGQAASTTIDYRTRGGPIEHTTTNTLPWAVSLEVPKGEALHITASGRALWGESTIVCEILVDGVVRAKATGVGFLAVAACKAAVQ